MTEFTEVKSQIKKRNYREWVACSLVLPSFIYIGLQKETFIGKILCFEISMAALFISYYLYLKSHKSLKNLNESRPSQISIIKNEIKLLKTVRYWYLLPIGFGLIGLTLEDLYFAVQDRSGVIVKVIYLFSIIALGVLVIYLNEKKSVDKLKSQLSL